MLKEHGVDVMDVSTGGIMSGVSIPVKPNYQVPFSEQVKAKADIPVTAVCLITKPKQAAKILAHGEADAVEIGRAALRDPYWPLRAANKLGIPVKPSWGGNPKRRYSAECEIWLTAPWDNHRPMRVLPPHG